LGLGPNLSRLLRTQAGRKRARQLDPGISIEWTELAQPEPVGAREKVAHRVAERANDRGRSCHRHHAHRPPTGDRGT
jgi:hypothetical protein